MATRDEQWPALPLESWEETCSTLHLWTQIVGKIRLAYTPWLNHGWHAPLYVTACGLTTSPIPCGTRSFDLEFDFLDHRLLIRTSTGDRRSLPLQAQTVAAFYEALMRELNALGLTVHINTHPNERDDAIPFPEDSTHRSYAPDAARNFFRVLAQAARLLQRFRARFSGKCSPVQFFWGSFDLAVSRFSGRPAPQHPGGIPHLPDWVTREAYSHEVCSAGFWPGGGPHRFPLFYSYVYPEPEGFSTARIAPEAAFYSPQMGEYLLPYEAVRQTEDPDQAVLTFLQSTYEAAARLGHWDSELDFDFQPPAPAGQHPWRNESRPH